MKGFYATIRYLGMGRLFVYCLACFSINALANTYPATHKYYDLNTANSYTTANPACMDYFNRNYGSILDSLTVSINNNGMPSKCTFVYRTSAVGAQQQVIAGVNILDICPTGATIGGVYPNKTCTDTCTAPQRMNSVTGTCYTPSSCNAGKDSLTGTDQTSSGNDSRPCINGCLYNKQPLNSLGHTTAQICSGGTCTYEFKAGDNLGISCDASTATASTKTTTQKDCIKAGKTFGQVNGLDVCLANGTVGAPTNTLIQNKSKTETDNSPNSTPKTTDTEIKQNPDGSITKKETTSDGKTKQTNQDLAGFCEENPNSPLCKASESLCEKNPDIPACKEWCDKSENIDKLACQDMGTPDDGTDLTTHDVDLNFNPAVGGTGTCPSDIVMPHNIPSLPVHAICDQAAIYRPFVLLFSSLAAAYIIFGYRNKE